MHTSHETFRPEAKASPEESRFDAVIIGGGQAGLSAGYHLMRRGLRIVILDAGERVGDTWRRRWDSLRLFSPARFDGLDGLPFPAEAGSFPTKDEMAAYLETYAEKLELPVRSGVKVDRVSRHRDGYLVRAGRSAFVARHVVVATGAYQRPFVPGFAGELSKGIVQLHASDYRNPAQLQRGTVLVVGAGNSGAEIALELTRSRHVLLAGPDTGQIPFRNQGKLGRFFLFFLFRVIFHRLLTIRTPMGRKTRKKTLGRPVPLIRTRLADLRAAGVERVDRVAGVHEGRPMLANGQVLEVANVVWCTGYRQAFSWIDLPIFDESGAPRHQAGVVPGEAGLYFVGLHFLYAMSSSMIHGVGRDAERIATTIAARSREETHALLQ